jgi:metal-sulfur cluster biosynthetic enzyme
MAVTVEQVRGVLKTIFDPEIHLSILDLGLIYGVEVVPDGNGKDKVAVRMTLTTPACPYGPALLSKVHADVGAMAGVSDVKVDLAWIPPWDPRTMASDEAKLQMGLFELDDDDDDDSPLPESAASSLSKPQK